MAWLGVDIGGTRIKCALLDAGRQVARATSKTYNRPDTLTLTTSLREVMSQLSLAPEDVDGVGLCIPGVRSPDGSMIEYAANVPGLQGVPFPSLIAELGLGQKRFITTSDAEAASQDAIDQLRLTGRVVVISIGAGVGMATLDDGQPIKHTDGGAGHLGQIDVSVGDNPPLGPDGGRGSLEAYVGASALRTRFGDRLDDPVEAFKSDPVPLIALARAIRIVHVMYKPNTIVLVGGLGHRLRDTELESLVERDLSSLARADAKLVYGIDDFHAARGAARLASLAFENA